LTLLKFLWKKTLLNCYCNGSPGYRNGAIGGFPFLCSIEV